MNQDLFMQTCNSVIHHKKIEDGIGTLSEKTIHSVIKHYLEPDTRYHEVKVGTYFADIASPQGIIEIQTRGFDKLRRKLEVFLIHSPVTIVYPVAYTKYLRWINKESGEITPARKSPKQGTIYEIFPELYKIKFYLKNPNLKLKILLIHVEEYRYLDGWSKDKKKGSTRCDGIPLLLENEISIESLEDYNKFIPTSLNQTFTTKDFLKHTKTSGKISTTALNILHHTQTVDRVGKNGRSYLYSISSSIESVVEQ